MRASARRPTANAAGLRPPAAGRLALGLDIGGSHMAAGLVDASGRVHGWRRRALDAACHPDRAMETAAALLDEVLAAHPEQASQVVGVGMGLPGMVEVTGGRLVFAPNLRWTDYPAADRLAGLTGLAVVADNDARLATLAEALFGAARGCSDVLGVIIGTGIGGGIILDGRLFRGPGGTAGEIGHLTLDLDGPACRCGNRGCLETLVAGPAIAAAGRAALARAVQEDRPGPLRSLCEDDPAAVTAAAVSAAAAAGDQAAREILARAGTWLGIALAGCCNLINPRLVVVGGGVAEAGELLLGPARCEIARRTMSVPRAMVDVVTGELGAMAGVIGAGALVLGDY